jgi:hypothetical protein
VVAAGRRRRRLQQLGPQAQPGPTSHCCCCNTQTVLLLPKLPKRHDELSHTKQLRVLAYFFGVCSLLFVPQLTDYVVWLCMSLIDIKYKGHLIGPEFRTSLSVWMKWRLSQCSKKTVGNQASRRSRVEAGAGQDNALSAAAQNSPGCSDRRDYSEPNAAPAWPCRRHCTAARSELRVFQASHSEGRILGLQVPDAETKYLKVLPGRHEGKGKPSPFMVSSLKALMILFMYELMFVCSPSLFYLPTHSRCRSYLFSLDHTHTPHSLRLLWTRDRPVAETSTWQHKHCTRDKHPRPRWDSNPRSQQALGRRPTP